MSENQVVTMELRGYQEEVLGVLKGGSGNSLIQAPTGAGKTIMFSKFMAESGQKCLVLAHRGELVRQARDKLEMATGLKCGVFSAYLKKKEVLDITVASIQSFANWKGDINNFDIIIIDECHRVPAKVKDSQYSRALEGFNGRLIGFTATPYRLDDGEIYGKGEWWERLDFEIPIRQLIDEGHLTDYKHYVSQYTDKIRSDVKQLKTTAGDYNEGQAGDLMSSSMSVHAVLNTVPDERRHIVVFCVNILHAETLYRHCKGTKGIIHSKLDTNQETLKDFDDGKIRWLFNVGVLTEGWDCTRVDAVVLARPTKSTALYVQMIGRGLRLHKGKEWCYIYDVVANFENFGFIDDPNIFTQNRDMGEGGEAKTKVCSECFAVIAANCQSCPECGFKEEKEEVIVDDEEDFYVMREAKDLSSGDVTGGYASVYKDDCMMVEYYHSSGKTIRHFYTLKKEHKRWMGKKLANIIKRYYKFDENWIEPERYIKAINSGVLFPMKGLRIKKDKGGYEKISSL